MDARTQTLFKDFILEDGASRYGLSPTDLSFLGGFMSFVYQFKHEGRAYILRFSHSAHRSHGMLRAEVDWIHYLAKNGISVACPIRSENSLWVERIPADEGEFLAVGFEKAPGEPPGSEDWSPVLFQVMGEMMGKMHILAKEYLPQNPEYQRLDWYTEAKAFAEEFADVDPLLVKKFNANLDYLRRLPVSQENFGLVHTDFHRGNFFLDNGQITLFDFDDCQYSWFADDIALSLFYAIPLEEKPEIITNATVQFLEPFLQGYLKLNRVALSWFVELPYFMKTREIAVCLALLRDTDHDLTRLDGWPARFMLGRRERIVNDEPVLTADLLRIAEKYLSS